MSSNKTDEQYKLWFKASFNALTYINERAEAANEAYADLLDKFNRYIVISDEVDGRQSQLVKISTTFGTEDPADPNVKEFLFNPGSVLRYSRVLPVTHSDALEVVNFQTLMNVLYNNTSNINALLVNYLLKTGDTAIGSYTFSRDPGGASGQSITLNGIPLNIIGEKTSLETGVLQTVISNPKSLINKEYADLTYTQGLGAGGQPIFTSGKIGIHSTNNQSIIQAKSKYNVAAWTGGGTSQLKIKLLKYNAKTSWDATDKSWVELFGNTPQPTIPGFNTGAAVGKIPYPVDFSLYVEYAVDQTTFPFALINGNARVRAQIPNTISSAGGATGILEWSLIIDSDGDLALIMETNYIINIPYANITMSTNCNSSSTPLFYLVVNRWSYLPKESDYIDQIGTVNPTPTLLFTNTIWNRGIADTGVTTVRYRLLYANITGAITWSSNQDVTLGITYGTDGSGYYADIAFPIGETIYSTTFTANFGTTLTKTVNLQLTNYAYNAITNITPTGYATSRYDGSPDPLNITFTCTAVGGSGTKTWSVLSSDVILGTTTLGAAAIGGSTGIVTGQYSTANVDEYIIIQVTDGTSTYNQKLTIHVLELTSGGGPGPGEGCFTPDTYILTTKGGIKISKITLEDTPINLNLERFEVGQFELRTGKILNITHHIENFTTIDIHGIQATPNHPFGLGNGLWKEASSVLQSDYLVKLIEPDTIIKEAFSGSKGTDYNGDVWNIHLEELNYFVSNNENGPWYLVHNAIKILTMG